MSWPKLSAILATLTICSTLIYLGCLHLGSALAGLVGWLGRWG